MTTIVYKEETITSKSAVSGTPRNIQTTKTFTVKIMGDTPPNTSSVGGGSRLGTTSQRPSRGGSPNPDKRFNVKSKGGGKHTTGKHTTSYTYDPRVFTITAYLPHDGGKRLKVKCCVLLQPS